MRSRKQTPPELNGDHVDEPPTASDPSTGDALALAEEAEAEAAEAEAVAAAARARARALRLRREAEEAEAKAAETIAAPEPETVAAPEPEEDAEEAEDTEEAEDATEEAEKDEAVDGDEAEKASAAVIDDSAAEEADEKPARKRPGVRIRIPLPTWKGIAATFAVLIIAALLTGCVLMFIGHRKVQAELQHRAEFEAAARQGVVTLMSLDYNKAKENVQHIIDSSTGQFKTDFQNTADDFVKVATDSKAVTETNVTATAVESMNGDDTATVLVAATSRVTNAAGAKQEPRAWRLSVNLARDGGQLKLAKVEFVP
jgi:Mce-associated membrane protein